jgi:hypothetical protein
MVDANVPDIALEPDKTEKGEVMEDDRIETLCPLEISL